jgi:hypothetical protein
MVMSLGFISFYNLMIGINENKTKNIIFAGILAGLSTFTHLNGAIFCVAGFLLLILNKKLKEALLFGVFAFCFSALYFWDLRTIAEIKSWYVQFRLEPIIIEKENIFMSIMHEQKRFFHSEREIVFSLMFFIGLFVNFVKFKNKSVFVGSDRDRNFLIYTILLMISLMLISANKTSKYSILYFPEMAIVIAITLMKLKDKTKLFKIFFIGLFIAYIAIHSYHDTKVLRSKLNVKLRNEQISKLIPEKHVKVIAPESFVFNQIDNYTVYGYVAFSYFYTIFYPNKPKDIYEYLLFSKSKDVKYVIIDEKQDGRNFDYKLLDSFVLNQNINGYDLIRREDGLYIFEKI